MTNIKFDRTDASILEFLHDMLGFSDEALSDGIITPEELPLRGLMPRHFGSLLELMEISHLGRMKSTPLIHAFFHRERQREFSVYQGQLVQDQRSIYFMQHVVALIWQN